MQDIAELSMEQQALVADSSAEQENIQNVFTLLIFLLHKH